MSKVTAELLTKHRDGAVAYLTLNRPKAGNSLSRATIAELHSALDDLADDTDVNVIVIGGTGGRIFCAGHDLREFDDAEDIEFFNSVSSECSAMMQAIVKQPQIVIASVEGVATAAGCQLVATCDLAVASEEARFATPGVNIGLWCLTPMVGLSRAVGRKHAMQMLAGGQLHDADFAFRIGLVNQVAKVETLAAEVKELADNIASKSGYTLALGKRGLYQQMEMTLPNAYEYAGELVGRNMLHHDAKEGIRAFLEKRDPVWRGRKPEKES
ncbi:MAG: enoyl-CoA hydratase/carnithine racemase [Alphaproteobacteria bacterium]|jgi:enoyl-CoA hydratase/carnithine racemase